MKNYLIGEIKLTKESLELFIYKQTGGRYDPILIRGLISIMKEWVTENNLTTEEILENLWWNRFSDMKND